VRVFWQEQRLEPALRGVATDVCDVHPVAGGEDRDTEPHAGSLAQGQVRPH
jgi:hypothetical protein